MTIGSAAPSGPSALSPSSDTSSADVAALQPAGGAAAAAIAPPFPSSQVGRASPAPTNGTGPSAKQPCDRILLVDDNPRNLQMLLQFLGGRGHTLLVAKSGEAALEIAAKSRPAVILLDVMMPGIDGFETCRRLKSDARTRDAAVLFLSAAGETEQKLAGFEAGGVDYITKPIQG